MLSSTISSISLPLRTPAASRRLTTARADPKGNLPPKEYPPSPVTSIKKWSSDQSVKDRPKPNSEAVNPLEMSRTYRRTVFDLDDWKRHRESSRYFRHMVTLPESGIFMALLPFILALMGETAMIELWHVAEAAGSLGPLPAPPHVHMTPFNITAFALSLLLVFRTNSGYGRFDEARKMWGLVVNRTRDFVSQSESYIAPTNPETAIEVALYTKGFVKCLMNHFRDDVDLPKELKSVGFTDSDIENVLASNHRPLFCIKVLRDLIEEGTTTGSDGTGVVRVSERIAMDANVTSFGDQLGGCERLMRTPVPLFYYHHISRFITIWLATLPFGLVDEIHGAAIPVMGVVTFLLLAIDEVGVQVEEPFGVLPLEAITARICADIDEMSRRYGTDERAKTAGESGLLARIRTEREAAGEHKVKVNA